MAQSFVKAAISVIGSALKIVWLTGARIVHFVAHALAWMFIVLAVITLHLPVGRTPLGRTPLDWFTVVLGLYTTTIVHFVLGDLEEHFNTPPVVRFLVANYIGATSAATVATSGFDWDDSSALVAVFGGFAIFVTGINNLKLFLVLSETIDNPFFRMAAALAMATIAGATAAALCPHSQRTEKSPQASRHVDLDVVESRILFYAAVSTMPLLFRYAKQSMRRFNTVSMSFWRRWR